MSTAATPTKIYLKDYRPPAFAVDHLDLFFDLHEDFCRVKSSMKVRRLQATTTSLLLDGVGLQLESVHLNGHKLTPQQYQLTDATLTVQDVPDEFALEIVVTHKPQENSSLEGLYKSGSIFCTQCEAQGFRRITYFFDRPDVMTTFTVSIEADEEKYPVLLSNGDRKASKRLNNGRHQATWQDPHKKPCYLFALVAGDLGVIKDSFVTMSGKKVQLEIYAAHGQQDRCWHAMESLKKSMQWDEERFGREYDLSTYMILAVEDFNAGAMENKGLNIFNSRLVLADPKSATDDDYYNIESVVAHEYFHNWTGNRVTLRDWFHLSLKEGLTVFRDQEFSMDLSSRAMVRIENVNGLRSLQFAEDAGPNAHPIRPESCYAVDNFFTSTIYEKGAEVIRMMQTMVGRPGFRAGMDLYFQRHDGQAVIIEDFAKAIADANKQEWEQFKLWYSQSGTPRVQVCDEGYEPSSQTYTLRLEQSCPATPDQSEKKPFHIPLIIGLLNRQGEEIALESPQVVRNTEGQNLIHLKEAAQTFVFKNIPQKPVLSLNRQFSAPIHLEWQASDQDLLFLLEHDSDAFNRWEASQKISLRTFAKLIACARAGQPVIVAQDYLKAFDSVVLQAEATPDLSAKILSLPDDSYLTQHQPVLDARAFFTARETLEVAFCQRFESQWLKIYQNLHGKNITSREPADFARRRLKNLALSYLCQNSKFHELAYRQFQQTQIMTDQEAALQILCQHNGDLRLKALQEFHQKWKHETTVLNKWFAIQALSSHPDTFTNIIELWQHPDFNKKNPNRVYALLWRFGKNLVRFHEPGKDTYSFMADRIIELDAINPHVATRVADAFNIWTKLPEPQRSKAHQQLERLLRASLSKNTYEIVSKAAAVP